MLMASLTVGALFLGSTHVEKPLRAEERVRTEKRVEKPSPQKMIEPLKGAGESTQLPETARYDARGGVLI